MENQQNIWYIVDRNETASIHSYSQKHALKSTPVTGILERQTIKPILSYAYQYTRGLK